MENVDSIIFITRFFTVLCKYDSVNDAKYWQAYFCSMSVGPLRKRIALSTEFFELPHGSLSYL